MRAGGARLTRIASAEVENAAALLPREDPLAHLFYEEREDRRLRVSDRGIREEARSWTCGACAVARITAQLSVPGPRDLAELARAASAGTRVPGASVSPPDDVGPTMDDRWPGLDTFADWLTDGAIPGSAAIEAKLVAHNQDIWVCRPGQEPESDVRRGQRLEVRATWRRGAFTGEAVEECVLTDGEPLPADAVGRALARAEHRAREVRPNMGGWVETAAVFAPATAGVIIHELIGHALEGDVVAAGRSYLAGESGLALPKILNVVDDPRRSRAPWTLDDEGTPASVVTLIEGGAVAGVLHDTASGLANGSTATGHGRRGSYLGAILPRAGCTFIPAGAEDPGAILAGTARGVFVRRIVAGEATPVAGTGTFLVTDADIIEGGRLGAPLNPFPMFIDLRRHLASIDAIGSDLAFDRCIGSCVRDGQPIATSVGAPTIRLRVIKARL